MSVTAIFSAHRHEITSWTPRSLHRVCRSV